MNTKHSKHAISPVRNQIRRFYLTLIALGFLTAFVFFGVRPLIRKNKTTRVTEGQRHRDAGSAKIKTLQTQQMTLTTNYNKNLTLLSEATKRLAILETAYAEASNTIAEMQIQLDEAAVKVSYEVNKNAVVETESVRQQNGRLRAEDALKESMARQRGLERQLKAIKEKQIDHTDYNQALAEQERLNKKNSQYADRINKLQQQLIDLGNKLIEKDRKLAISPSEETQKVMSKEMMNTVVAAQLRMLNYDAGYVLRMLKAQTAQLKRESLDQLTDEQLRAWEKTLNGCIERLEQSRAQITQ